MKTQRGGGTWETWKDNRPNYKYHADKLAEALSLLMRTANDTLRHPTVGSQLECLNDCVQQCNITLANYEKSK